MTRLRRSTATLPSSAVAVGKQPPYRRPLTAHQGRGRWGVLDVRRKIAALGIFVTHNGPSRPRTIHLAERVGQGLGWLTRGRQAEDRAERLLYFFTAIEALPPSTFPLIAFQMTPILGW
jgi:hypothetical protein